jgi:hypothetical protein
VSLLILVRSPIVAVQHGAPAPQAPGITVIDKTPARTNPQPEWIFVNLGYDGESLAPPGWVPVMEFTPTQDQDEEEQAALKEETARKPRTASRYTCNRKTFMHHGRVHWYCKR